MKTFKEFINEKEELDEFRTIYAFNRVKPNTRFHAGGTTSDRLLIFDIDDTILTGEVYILIRDAKTGKYLHKVNSNEFNTYKLKPGEEFDFSEFADPEIFEKNKITRYFDTMQREYKRGTHICLLTARGGKEVAEMISDFFKKKGIYIKEELLICINSEDSPYKGTTAERKAEAIKELYNAGYNTMIFFDDNKENLEEARKVADELGIHMVIKHVNIHSNENEPYIRNYGEKVKR